MSKHGVLILCFILFAGALVADVFVGGSAPADVVRLLRLPRAVTAAISGAVLSLAGAQMQSIFRNPLADPHIMGVSSGAGLGAALVTLAGGSVLPAGAAGLAVARHLSGISLALGAALGALAVSLAVIFISKKVKGAYTLLIFGVMAGFACNAIVSLLQSWASPESLKLYYSWAAGSFSHCQGPDLVIICAAAAVGILLAIANAKGLDIILFGDTYASLCGARPRQIRAVSLIGCCIVTGAVTAFCGPIGFVGIIAPHIARKITGTSVHRVVLPASLFAGGFCALAADIIANVSPVPLPAGSTMALIGIPVILYIILSPASRGSKAASESGQMPPAADPSIVFSPSPGSDVILSVEGLKLACPGTVLCPDVSFRAHRGDCILLCGANGSGKTSLLKALAGGRDRSEVVMIPSDVPKAEGFTLEEFIRTGCFTLSDWQGKMTREDRSAIARAMERLGIRHLSRRCIHTLSDGEFQKACLASALSRKATVILLDEPTAYLDAENKAEVLSLFRDIAREDGIAVIFSSHDLSQGLRCCNRVAAIGADRTFRTSSQDTMEEKLRIASSIFRNKNITFGI